MTTDSDAVRTRLADSAAAAASRAYEAAYGNPVHAEPRGVRWRLDWRVAGTVALALALVGLLAWNSTRAGAAAPVAVVDAGASAAAADGAPGAGPAGGSVWVHVAGAVKEPGLVELPAGSRVGEAIELAGGFTKRADRSAVNLARLVDDGEQVFVPRRSQSQDGPLNINRATAEQLEDLPGVGPVIAARIVAYRDQHGPFPSVDALARVSGIGAAIVAGLAGEATV